jgi:hypothetical protein
MMKDFSTNIRAGVEVTEAGSAESVARREEAIYASLERKRYGALMEAKAKGLPDMAPKGDDEGKIGATTATGTDRLIELLAEIARNTSKDDGVAGRRPKAPTVAPANFRGDA